MSNSNSLTGLSLIVAEQTLLRAAVADPTKLPELGEELFISETAVALGKTMRELSRQNVTLNARNLSAELTRRGESVKEADISTFLNQTPPSREDYEYWRGELKKERAKHNIQDAIINGLLPATASKGSEGSRFDESKMEELIATVRDNLDLARGNETVLYTAPQLLQDYDQIITQRSQGSYYYDTGCHNLNSALTEGFPPGKITTIFGSSGVGKSTYALYLVNRQINKRIPNLYISLEMDKISTLDRLIAQRNRVPISELIPNRSRFQDDAEGGIGMDSDFVRELLDRERKRLGVSKTFHFIEEPGLSLDDVEAYVRRIQDTLGVSYLVVTIDLLTMIREFNEGGDSPAVLYERAMNKLHSLVKRTGIHAVGVVQSRRPQSKVSVNSVEDMEKFRPRIEEIKNSAAIEERSRIILSTFRKKFYLERNMPEAPEMGIWSDMMEVQVLKQNMGSLPKQWYAYDGPSAYLCPYFPGIGEDPYTGTFLNSGSPTPDQEEAPDSGS